MEKAFMETAMKINGVLSPVECLYMDKTTETPDLYAHFHEFIEILYLTSGHMNIWLNDKLFDFLEGELVVINSNETHRLISLTPVSEYTVLKFNPLILYGSQQLLEPKYILPFITDNSNQPRVFSKEFVDSTRIPAIIDDAMNEWESAQVGFDLALKADMMKIFTIIIRYLDRQGINVKIASMGNNMYNSITEILDYINNGFRTINEKETADKFGISYSYFSRSFKNIMKMSFKEYINYLKINEAQRLLLTTDKSVTEISMELGFSSSSHFINVFRTYKSCSPKQYKKSEING